MGRAKVNESEPCCHGSTIGGISICRVCGNAGRSIKAVTLSSLVKKSRLESVKSLDGFYFCETPGCEVVYFNNEQGVYG